MVDKIWYNMEELIGGSEERGINRNIVECKARKNISKESVVSSINRNIVECKGTCSHAVQSRTAASINRNIVECKGIFLSSLLSALF